MFRRRTAGPRSSSARPSILRNWPERLEAEKVPDTMLGRTAGMDGAADMGLADAEEMGTLKPVAEPGALRLSRARG